MNCKPGDLAVIMRSQFEENLYRFVWVRRAVPKSEWTSPSLLEWECESAGSPLSFEWSDGSGTGTTMKLDICDRNLKPIRPDAAPESVTREKELSE